MVGVLGLLVLAPMASLLFQAYLNLGDEEFRAYFARVQVGDLLGRSLLLAWTTTLIALLLGLPLAFLTELARFPGRGALRALVFLPLLIPPHIHSISWARVIGDRGWWRQVPSWLEESTPLGWAVPDLARRIERSWLNGLFDLDMRAPLVLDPSVPVLSDLYLGPSWIMACAFFPFVTLSVAGGIRQLDGEGLLAARQLGGRRLELRNVLSQVLPQIFTGATFVFLLALSTYPVVSLLDTPVLIKRIFYTFQKVDQTQGALLAAPLVLAALACVAILMLFERSPRGTALAKRPLEVVRLRGWRKWEAMVRGYLPLVLASGVPLASLAYAAGPVSLDRSEPDNYQLIFTRLGVAWTNSPFGDSLRMAIFGVLTLLVLGYPIGRVLARQRRPSLEVLSLSGLALPPVVVAVALITWWNAAEQGSLPAAVVGLLALTAISTVGRARWGRTPVWLLALLLGWGVVLVAPTSLAAAYLPGLACLLLLGLAALRPGEEVSAQGRELFALRWVLILGGAWALLGPLDIVSRTQGDTFVLVMASYGALFLPFIVRLMRNGFQALDPEEIAVAKVIGLGPIARWWRIEWPRMRAVIGNAAIMAYVLCFTELSATLLTIPPGAQSVQIRIFNMIHYRAIGEVAALCLLCVALTALPVVVWSAFSRRKVELW